MLEEAKGYIAEAIGKNVGDEAVYAYVADQLAKSPSARYRMKGFLKAKGLDRGQLVRTRPAYKYSTVYAQYGVGGVPPAAVSADLYAIPRQNADPVFGAIDITQTNQGQAARQDSDQQFIATHHGFQVYVVTPVANQTTEDYINITQAWWGCAATFLLGTEAQQIWGPIGHLCYPFPASLGNVPVSDAAAPVETQAFVAATPVLGYADLHALKPNIVLGAGQQFRISLTVPNTIATVADFEDAIVAIRHVFYGRTRTAISG